MCIHTHAIHCNTCIYKWGHDIHTRGTWECRESLREVGKKILCKEHSEESYGCYVRLVKDGKWPRGYILTILYLNLGTFGRFWLVNTNIWYTYLHMYTTHTHTHHTCLSIWHGNPKSTIPANNLQVWFVNKNSYRLDTIRLRQRILVEVPQIQFTSYHTM